MRENLKKFSLSYRQSNEFVVKYNKRKIVSMVSGILLYSFFIVTWIPINFVSIFSKQTKWEQIKHTRSVRIEDIVKG